MKIDLPTQAGIPDADLCIVLGNIFENAAKAVVAQQSGRRFITSRCGMENASFVVTVDNSCGPSSETGSGEGLGLASVTAVTKRYNGTAQFTHNNDSFQSSVLLLLPSS